MGVDGATFSTITMQIKPTPLGGAEQSPWHQMLHTHQQAHTSKHTHQQELFPLDLTV